jgi:hypothetical protein
MRLVPILLFRFLGKAASATWRHLSVLATVPAIRSWFSAFDTIPECVQIDFLLLVLCCRLVLTERRSASR